MYHDYYNLVELPFEGTPDPRFFFESEQHREALAATEYTVRARKGFALITGVIGAGKTMIARAIAQKCAGACRIIHLLHGLHTREEVLLQIVAELGVKPTAADRASLLFVVRDQLLRQALAGEPVCVIVDEAQTLSDEALDELRLLSNFDTPTERSSQVVLIGQTELRQRLLVPELAPLRQRLAMARTLGPLSEKDTAAYIAHRIAVASRCPKDPGVSFTDDAVREIHGRSGGAPRAINLLCDNCLLLGFVKEARQITPNIVRRVVADILPALDSAPASYLAPANAPRLTLARAS